MAYLIGGARHDEHGACYENGKAGDQTGSEVQYSAWWNYPWSAVYRCTDTKVRDKLANNMIDACNNNNIGYDMNDRNSLYKYWKAQGKDIAKVTTACECDCSSLVSLCVTQAGIDILTGTNNAPVTATLGDVLMKTGKFQKITGKILTDPSLLVRGDILVKPYGHTEIYLGTSAAKVDTSEKSKNYAVKYRAHVQNEGWQAPVGDGETAGTEGKSRRLECIEIECPEGVKVSADAHIQGIGDVHYDAAQKLKVGTTGEGRRLEAFSLKFDGLNGKKAYYQAHAQKLGWSGKISNGSKIGTMGYGLRLEAIRIWFE